VVELVIGSVPVKKLRSCGIFYIFFCHCIFWATQVPVCNDRNLSVVGVIHICATFLNVLFLCSQVSLLFVCINVFVKIEGTAASTFATQSDPNYW